MAAILVVALGAIAWSIISLASKGKDGPNSAEHPDTGSVPADALDVDRDRNADGAPVDSGQRSSLTKVPPPVSSRADVLPTERAFLRGAELSVDAVANVIYGNRFEEAVESLGLEAANDPEALEIQRLYTNEIRSAIDNKYESLRLMGLSCGMSLCAGIMRGYGGDSKGEYDDWKASLDHPTSMRTYSFVDGVMMTADQAEYRFFFSVDPMVTGLHSGGRPNGE